MSIRKIDQASTSHRSSDRQNEDVTRQLKVHARERSFGLTSDSDFATGQRIKSSVRGSQSRMSYAQQQSGSSQMKARQGDSSAGGADPGTESHVEQEGADSPSSAQMSVKRGLDSRLANSPRANPYDVDRFEMLLADGMDAQNTVSDFDPAGFIPAGFIPAPFYDVFAKGSVNSRSSESQGKTQSGGGKIDAESPVASRLQTNASFALQTGLADHNFERGNSSRPQDTSPDVPTRHEAVPLPSATWLMTEGSHFELVVQTRDLGPLHLSATQHNGSWQVRLRSDSHEQQSLLHKVSSAISRGLSRDLGVPVMVEVDG